MCEDGWREAMVGTIGFYDKAGERQHTVSMAATPEYGKATFLGRLESEVARVKAKYPAKHPEVQVVDFWHAVEYLGKAAAVFFFNDPATTERWIEDNCHTLKHD